MVPQLQLRLAFGREIDVSDQQRGGTTGELAPALKSALELCLNLADQELNMELTCPRRSRMVDV